MKNIPLKIVPDFRGLPTVDSMEELLSVPVDSVYRNSSYEGFRTELIKAQFPKEYVLLLNAYLIFDEFDHILVLDESFNLHESFYPKSFWYQSYVKNDGDLAFSGEKLVSAVEIDGLSFITSNTTVSENIFHLIIDSYSRLLYFDKTISSSDATAIFPLGKSLSKDQLRFHLTFTDRIKNRFLTRGIYKCKRLLIPPRSFIHDYLMIDPFMYARERILNSYIKKQKYHKTRLFISRADTAIRNLSNEAELIAALRPLGFTAICSGDFFLENQFEMFSSAEIIVGVHGMGLAAISALSPSCKGVFEYEAQNWSITGYRSMCAVMGIRHGFLPNKVMEKREFGTFNWVAEADIAKSVEIIQEVLDDRLTEVSKAILSR